MKRVVIGWYGEVFDTNALYDTKVDAEKGDLPEMYIDDILGDLCLKKIKITVEVLED